MSFFFWGLLLPLFVFFQDMELKQEAGSYLQEFVVWSIKQSKANSTVNANIKSLLNRLYFLLRHPDVNKRLGGCVVFTQIYRIFREDKNLVSEYLFEILASFLQCFKISESDPPFSATVPECEKNLGHLKRILLHYLADFQVRNIILMPKKLYTEMMKKIASYSIVLKMSCVINFISF